MPSRAKSLRMSNSRINRRNPDVIDDAAAAGMQIYGDIWALPSWVLQKSVTTALAAKDAVKKHAKRILANPTWDDTSDVRQDLVYSANSARNVAELARIYQAGKSKGWSDVMDAVEARAANLRLSMAKIKSPEATGWGWNPATLKNMTLARKRNPNPSKVIGLRRDQKIVDKGRLISERFSGSINGKSFLCSIDASTGSISWWGAGLTGAEKQDVLAGIDAIQESTDYSKYTNPRVKRNSESGAAKFYEKFHGAPSTEEIIVENEIHEHEHLGVIGLLVAMVVDTPLGERATITFESFGSEQSPWLCSSEDGCQLFIEGGNQALDLKALGMDGEDWYKERMVIGTFSPPESGRKWNLSYLTSKDFDRFEPIEYQHDLGEANEGEPKSMRREPPVLEYEPLNRLLFISGGQYKIGLPLFGTSPGIEN